MTTGGSDNEPRTRRFRPILLVATVLLVIGQIVALSPSSLEESRSVVLVEPEKLLEWVSGDSGAKPMLAKGIPTGRIPDYSVDQFDFVSSREGVRDWQLQATRAHLFNQEKIVHATTIKAFLFDAEGKATVVTGKEAKYFMNDRDLEIYGDVLTLFPDGFQLRSEYLRYRPKERHVQIPVEYPVKGDGIDQNRTVSFRSHGFDYTMAEQVIKLPAAVTVLFGPGQEPAPSASSSPGPVMASAPAKTVRNGSKDAAKDSSVTTIESDRCLIQRKHQIANFTMNAGRPLAERFVKIRQPTLFVKSRKADLRYGDYSEVLHYMTATEDVLIQELGNASSLRYATAGKADFDSVKDLIVLSEFPQVYQDNDTVVGDVVVLHRKTDMVEVRNSNAFSESH